MRILLHSQTKAKAVPSVPSESSTLQAPYGHRCLAKSTKLKTCRNTKSHQAYFMLNSNRYRAKQPKKPYALKVKETGKTTKPHNPHSKQALTTPFHSQAKDVCRSSWPCALSQARHLSQRMNAALNTHCRPSRHAEVLQLQGKTKSFQKLSSPTKTQQTCSTSCLDLPTDTSKK